MRIEDDIRYHSRFRERHRLCWPQERINSCKHYHYCSIQFISIGNAELCTLINIYIYITLPFCPCLEANLSPIIGFLSILHWISACYNVFLSQFIIRKERIILSYHFSIEILLLHNSYETTIRRFSIMELMHLEISRIR